MARSGEGIVCLQGGAEFGPPCREMDADVLRRIGTGPIAVVALAAEPGREHDTATTNAVSYYRSLGAVEVCGAPDARLDAAGARSAVADAALVVIPGGSPTRLLNALRASGLDDALHRLVAGGGSISGASAGAMVLCDWTVLPEGAAPRLVQGLGVVPRMLVLPHYTGTPRWEEALLGLDSEVAVLGLPECAGVVVGATLDHTVMTAVGKEPTALLAPQVGLLAPGSSTPL